MQVDDDGSEDDFMDSGPCTDRAGPDGQEGEPLCYAVLGLQISWLAGHSASFDPELYRSHHVIYL